MASLTETVRFIESIFGRCVISRDERNVGVRCPICDPRDPSKKKLIIRLEDHVMHCWVCGWSSRTMAPLIKKFGTRDQLAHYASTMSPVKVEVTKRDDPEEKKLEIPQDISLLASMEAPDPDSIACIKYLKSRGITERDMWYFRLASSQETKWQRRVIFISHDANGDPNYLTGRAVDQKKFPRYVNCDVERSGIVFNELNIDWNLPLVLCEGPFDLIKCGENATCMLGSELSENSLLFNRIVSHATPVVIAMDADTYANKRPKLIKKLMEYDVVVKTVDLGKYPDPGSAPGEFVAEQISLASEVDWHQTFMTKLSNF